MSTSDFWRLGVSGLALVLLSLSIFTSTCQAGTNGMAEFKKMKYGFFVHYVWGGAAYTTTIDKDGKKPTGVDDLADRFDAQGLADSLSDWGVQYVIFTAWHANINPLFPSKTMEKWGLANHCPKRDVLRDLITACKAKGIKVMFYTHPRDGHDLRGEDQIKTGWGPGSEPNPDWTKFDKKKWNDFTNDLYGELVERYGDDIIGLYLDEGSGAGDSYRVVDYPRLRATIKKNHPDLIMVQNWYGNLYSCDTGDKEYHFWGEFEDTTGQRWATYRFPIGTCFASTWWASKPQGQHTPRFSPEAMYRFTILQAGANTEGGGIQWATAPYPGGGWETGVDETMRKIAEYMKPIRESMNNVYASRAFLTPQGMNLAKVNWGVATDAADDHATYIHVLKAPDGKSLCIGKAANDAVFASANLLSDGTAIALSRGDDGYTLTLPDNASWDQLNTVIKLNVDPSDLQHRRERTQAKLKSVIAKLEAAIAKHPQHPDKSAAARSLSDARSLGAQASQSELADRITLLENYSESVAEIPLPPPEKNLARAKSVAASSTHPSTQAQVLTNGNRDGAMFWSSGDAQVAVDHEESVMIDLGEEQKIQMIALIPRAADGGEGFPIDFKVNLSLDGATWTTARTVQDLPMPKGRPRTFSFDSVSARFVQIRATRLRAMPGDENRYRLQFSAIEVFGPTGK